MAEDEVTGWDEHGIEIRGPRALGVGDAGYGAEGKSPAELGNIALYGGPLDGMVVRAITPTQDMNQIEVYDAEGNRATDEIYLARFIDGQWFGVHADLLQEYVRSDEVHLKDPAESLSARMAASERTPWALAIPMCAVGEHQWSDWRLTPNGNRHRMCMKCFTTQATIL